MDIRWSGGKTLIFDGQNLCFFFQAIVWCICGAMLADPMIAAPNLVCCILMAEQPTNTWVKWEVGVPSDALSSYKDQF